MKNTTLSLTPAVPMHSMYRGKDVSKTIKAVSKANGFKEKNINYDPKLILISIADLHPLDSQRETKEAWARKRLTEQKMDWMAFQQLSVVKDIDDGKYYVWDGCGRLAIAQLFANCQGIPDLKVPCIVHEGEKKQTAFYFAYVQDEGRRSMSKEVLFVNRWFSEQDEEAQKEAQLLTQLKLFVKGDSGKSVPEAVFSDFYEIKYRSFHEAVTNQYMANNNIKLFEQAKDMVIHAFEKNQRWNKIVPQDVLWAVTCLLQVFPSAQNNGLNTALCGFLESIAMGDLKATVEQWKEKGMSGNAGVAPQLALGMLKSFMASGYWKGGFTTNNGIKQATLENIINKVKTV